MIERDYTAERLARIKVLLAAANQRKASMAPTDRPLARQLVVQLDHMLKELRQPDSGVSQSRNNVGLSERKAICR